jgi:RNA polymerase sigma-70 factor (ECF subfamily)
MRDSDEELRPLLFAIAYRMLGSAGDAEDLVQETLLRLHKEGEGVENRKAFATTVITRLAIDELRSARVRRETYVGTWLPEPIVDSAAAMPGPADSAELAESATIAFLKVLDTLAPVERAVFLLHDVFDYSYAEIAPMVGKGKATCRQIAARARQRIADGRPRFEPDRERREELVERFLAALLEGEVDKFSEMLHEDVVMAGDGGGKAHAASRLVEGRTAVARFLQALGIRGLRAGARAEAAIVNGEPGAVLLDADGRLVTVMAITVGEDGSIVGIDNQLNPDKLARTGWPLSDFALKRTAE